MPSKHTKRALTRLLTVSRWDENAEHQLMEDGRGEIEEKKNGIVVNVKNAEGIEAVL